MNERLANRGLQIAVPKITEIMRYVQDGLHVVCVQRNFLWCAPLTLEHETGIKCIAKGRQFWAQEKLQYHRLWLGRLP
jgi:hypothetical protein